MPYRPAPDDALFVVDLQEDFCPGGSLGVPDGHNVVPVVNELAGAVGTVVASYDSHPPDHVSFVDRGGPWPRHCIEGTPGWNPHPDARIDPAFKVFKGRDPEVDVYSAWTDDLHAFLQERAVRRVVLTGLALDYCVKASALDARAAGYEVVVLTDATRAVEVQHGDGERALEALRAAGVELDVAAAASSEVAPPA